MQHSKHLVDADTAHKNTADDSQAAQSDHAPRPEHAHLWPSHAAAKPVEPSRLAANPHAEPEHDAPEQQPESAPSGYSKRETEYMRSRGHHDLANELDG